MLLGMTGLGEIGERNRALRAKMAVGHVAGAVTAGAAMAMALWLLLTPIRTLLPPLISPLFVATTAVLAIAVDLGIVRQTHRLGQVPREYFRKWGSAKAYTLYGLRFGAGFTTLVPYAATYTLFAVLAIAQPFASAALCGAFFGLGRTVLIGPGSLIATELSRVLFRNRGVRRWWVSASLILSTLLAATQLKAL
jgi:hypothetical protein